MFVSSCQCYGLVCCSPSSYSGQSAFSNQAQTNLIISSTSQLLLAMTVYAALCIEEQLPSRSESGLLLPLERTFPTKVCRCRSRQYVGFPLLLDYFYLFCRNFILGMRLTGPISSHDSYPFFEMRFLLGAGGRMGLSVIKTAAVRQAGTDAQVNICIWCLECYGLAESNKRAATP